MYLRGLILNQRIDPIMKAKQFHLLVCLACCTWQSALSTAQAQDTAFTYQGQLQSNESPANGAYDFRFRLASDPLANNYVGSSFLTNGIPVSNGLFTVTIDFGAGIFTGSNYWLEVDVRTNGATSYAVLNPLQALTPTPYAVFAGGVNAAGLSGTLPPASLSGTYNGAVNLTNSGNNFSGNGAGLLSLNASQLTNGTVPAAALGHAWQTSGNAGTSPTNGNFVGTTDNHPLELWINQSRAFRLEPDTNNFGAPNVIGGAPNNFVDPGIIGATIAGGGVLNYSATGGFEPGPGPNHVSAIWGTIGGGRRNTVAADHSFIGGGHDNLIQPLAYDSAIGGGSFNTINSNYSESVIAGGEFNTVGGFGSTIGGGENNTIQNNTYLSVIAGGDASRIETNASYGVIGGGTDNTIQINAYEATIGGGYENTIQTNAYLSVIAGGGASTIEAGAIYAVIGGGADNTIQINAYDATIGGGDENTIQTNANQATIGGGDGNTILAGSIIATIAGGSFSKTGSPYTTIGGGASHSIGTNSNSGTISGGYDHIISDNTYDATIGGGSSHFIGTNSAYSTISGGRVNVIGDNATSSTIAGGLENSVQPGALYASLGGGTLNNISGGYATIPGGWGNSAAGQYSFAAGQYAQADYDGAFVWSDASTATPYSSTTSNQFAVRATGGVQFDTFGAGMKVDRQPVAITSANQTFTGANTFANSVQIGNASAPYQHLSMSGGNSTGFLYGSYPKWGDGIHLGYNYYANAVGADQIPNAGGGTSRISANYGEIVLAVGDVGNPPTSVMLDATLAGVTVYGTFNNLSDRKAKQDFAPVSPSHILEEVAQLPVSEWSYKTDPGTRHIGPVAQDFYSTFKIGTDDKHIAPIDEGGIALAAIQALNQKVNEKDQEIQVLKNKAAKVEALEKQVQELAVMVKLLAERK